MPEFEQWDSFCLIIGSAAAALIGLQFVVMTLIAERPPPRAAEAAPAFATPTIVHFGTALFVSALLRVPWHTITPPATLWGLMGFGGVGYAAFVARRIRRQAAYRPVLSDWWFYAALPFAANLVLAVSAIAAPSNPHDALFGVGAAALLLLFLGIHNAWDTVSYFVFVSRQDSKLE